MKKLVSMLLALTLVLIMGCAQAEDSTSETTAVRIGALKGPTSMGMAQMLKDAADGNSNYQFTIAGAPDEITALLVKGELDVAAVPSNLASVLYNNTNGGVKVAMIIWILTLLRRAIPSIRSPTSRAVRYIPAVRARPRSTPWITYSARTVSIPKPT